MGYLSHLFRGNCVKYPVSEYGTVLNTPNVLDANMCWIASGLRTPYAI